MRFRDIYKSNRERYFQRAKNELFGEVNAGTITGEDYLEELEELELSKRSGEFIFSVAIKSVMDKMSDSVKRSLEYYNTERDYRSGLIQEAQYILQLKRIEYLGQDKTINLLVGMVISNISDLVGLIIKPRK